MFSIVIGQLAYCLCLIALRFFAMGLKHVTSNAGHVFIEIIHISFIQSLLQKVSFYLHCSL